LELRFIGQKTRHLFVLAWPIMGMKSSIAP